MSLLDLFFPVTCLGCHKTGHYLCPTCLLTVDFHPPQRCAVCNRPAITGLTHPRCRKPYTIDGIYAIGPNHGLLSQAIKQLKYRHTSHLAHELATLIAHQLPSGLKHATIITEVPLHPQRLRWRGFNQAQLLAQQLSPTLNLPHLPNLLVKTQPTTHQAQITHRQQRLRNLNRAFHLHPKLNSSQLKNQFILLIDDITTTGTTLYQAALPLKRAGAAQVWGIVLAR